MQLRKLFKNTSIKFIQTYPSAHLKRSEWAAIKNEQNSFLSTRIKKLSSRLSCEEFSSIAKTILDDPAKPEGVSFRTLALEAVKKEPDLRPIIREWMSLRLWDEQWEAEGFESDGRMNDNNVIKELVIKRLTKNPRYDSFCEWFPKDAKTILEAGCGVSKIIVNWPLNGKGRTAIGIDNADRVIRVGNAALERFYKEKYPENSQARFKNGDIVNLKKDMKGQTVDVCFNSGVLEHLDYDDQVTLIKKMASIVNPGGKVIVSVPNYSSPSIILRRKIIQGVKRWNAGDSNLHFRWPYGFEQPMKGKELTRLLKDAGLKDVKLGGFTPFHDFMPKGMWRFGKAYGETRWHMPDEDILTRYGVIAFNVLNYLSAGKLHKCLSHKYNNVENPYKWPAILKGEYFWEVPLYAPLFYLSGLLLDQFVAKPWDFLLHGGFSRCFGNQIIACGTVPNNG